MNMNHFKSVEDFIENSFSDYFRIGRKNMRIETYGLFTRLQAIYFIQDIDINILAIHECDDQGVLS